MRNRNFFVSVIGTAEGEGCVRIEADSLGEAVKKFTAMLDNGFENITWQMEFMDIAPYISVIDSDEKRSVSRPWTRRDLHNLSR